MIGVAKALEFPEEVGSECYEEDDEGVFVLVGRAEGEVRRMCPKPPGTALRLACTWEVAAKRARRARLTRGQRALRRWRAAASGHAPADEDGAAEVEGPVELEVDVPRVEEGMGEGLGAEGGGGSGKEEVPAEVQKAEGEEPEGGQQGERGEA